MNAKELRKKLHPLAELGRKEFKTKEFILTFLKPLECSIFEVGKTGVVAYFDCGLKRTICFRADMDALPILEKTGLSYAPKTEGVSHACGHDGHMAMLLEFAGWASEHKNLLTSNIVCLFQPSEEEGAGAIDILASGILDKLGVEEIYGFHIWPGLEENKIFTKYNALLASSSEVDIEFIGKGVHAGNRSQGIDALYIASEFLIKFYELEKGVSGKHLVSFGKLLAGEARNSVASKATLIGTFRAFEDIVMDELLNKLYELCEELKKAYGVEIVIKTNSIYKSVLNHSDLINKFKDKLELNFLEEEFMQAEDFGCYTRKYKSLFFLLGSGNSPKLHTDCFDFNMDILETGVEAYRIIGTMKG